MCYVIITCRSLGWTLLSIAVALIIVTSVVSPYWLIGIPTSYGLDSQNESIKQSREEFIPTVGIFNRCRKLQRGLSLMKRENCATFVTGYTDPDDDFPHAWKAALVFFAIAGLLLSFAMILAVLSLFVRSFFGKSIFTIAGLVQSIAGLLSVLGLVVYPAGWGSDRINRLCGEYANPYIIDRCELGWSFYLCVVGTVLVFLCSILSIQADHSTTSRKVEEEVLEGKNLICVI
ncbi:LHFPL tetraspan subfamily member 2 protein-like [Ylistrum balloti]|uniref:LHFPL tetraspan subfamily member 2 protein-like n=1 Tax=Ylistrum balloti TaxID=509963 RepID=UPI002905E743|nr:LHFPL tetraspan subfamily member 2 protein-like [Ylistrum balloti]XP_060083570.1 LHFPL tetraspan subfamily member 2 protein-like [Ylistrum balloti]